MGTRRLFVLVAILLCCAAGSPQDARPGAPIFRCLLDPGSGSPGTVEKCGIRWADARVASERGFLETLFGVEAEFLLLDNRAPREAFVARGDPPRVALRADWLREQDEVEHRHARVAYALAHLYAHVLQEQRRCRLPERSRELHADLIAGWYLGKRNLGTLGSETRLDAAYAAALFAEPAEYRNERFEHGDPAMRAQAVAAGFRMRREEKLSLKQIYDRGLKLYPPPRVGLAGAPALTPAPRAPPGMRLVKVECTHPGPCVHPVPCVHRKPCEHKVACAHLEPCTHLAPRTVQVPCVHRMPCVHRISCTHRVPCVHTIPCTHRAHPYDLDHRGNRCECTHFLHNYDYLHNYDFEHEYDLEHEFDQMHDYDEEQRFEPIHDGHPIHEFDLAHDWDPLHEHDLAHESDALHDYDVKLEPAPGAGGSGG